MDQEEFYEKIPEWISKDKSTWNHITLMAYFCHKYEQKNGVRFRLVRWNTDPGKGKESKDFAKLAKTFLPENFEKLPKEQQKNLKEEVVHKIYNYINWMFDYKFRRGERSVTGTQLFLTPSIINEFERMYSAFLSKRNQEGSFEELMDWVKKQVPDILKLHDLEDPKDIRMIQRYAENYNLEQSSLEWKVVKKAKELNLL